MTLSDKEIMALLKMKALIKSGHPDMDEFLEWIGDRLVKVHGDEPLMDYIHAVRKYAQGIREIKELIY